MVIRREAPAENSSYAEQLHNRLRHGGRAPGRALKRDSGGSHNPAPWQNKAPSSHEVGLILAWWGRAAQLRIKVPGGAGPEDTNKARLVLCGTVVHTMCGQMPKTSLPQTRKGELPADTDWGTTPSPMRR